MKKSSIFIQNGNIVDLTKVQEITAETEKKQVEKTWTNKFKGIFISLYNQ